MSGVLCTWQGLQSGAVFFFSAAHPLGKMPVCSVQLSKLSGTCILSKCRLAADSW